MQLDFSQLYKRLELANVQCLYMRGLGHATIGHALSMLDNKVKFVRVMLGPRLNEVHREHTHRLWREYSKGPRRIVSNKGSPKKTISTLH